MYGLSTQKSGRCREVDTVNQIHCKGGLRKEGFECIVIVHRWDTTIHWRNHHPVDKQWRINIVPSGG